MVVVSLAHEMLTQVHGAVIPNPAPAPPKGLGGQANTIMSIIKWGSLFMIIASGFVGVGALSFGKLLSHHKSASTGISILLVAVISALLWVIIYPFLTSFTG